MSDTVNSPEMNGVISSMMRASASVKLNTSKFLEGLCHGWVHSLTRSGAVFKTTEVILREILLNHEAVDGRRGTERGDVILLNLVKIFG